MNDGYLVLPGVFPTGSPTRTREDMRDREAAQVISCLLNNTESKMFGRLNCVSIQVFKKRVIYQTAGILYRMLEFEINLHLVSF